jgi:hypothetical protein
VNNIEKQNPAQNGVGSTDAALSAPQVEKALVWAQRHRKHVESLATGAAHSYPPTLSEDKRRPELWKSGHWHWFLQRHPLPNNPDDTRGK